MAWKNFSTTAEQFQFELKKFSTTWTFQNSLQPILVRLEQFQYDLINKKKQEKKKGHYTNSGQIVVKSVNIEQVIKNFH